MQDLFALAFLCCSLLCNCMFAFARTGELSLKNIQGQLDPFPFSHTHSVEESIPRHRSRSASYWKRADELSWDDAVCHGEAVMSGIAAQRGHDSPSPFNDYAQIAKDGWKIEYNTQKSSPPESIKPVLDPDFRGNRWVTWSAKIKVKGKEYTVAWQIAPGFAIIVTATYPPDPGAMDRNQIQRPSDLLWLSWQKVCQDNKQDSTGLRALYRDTVRSQKTASILQQACDKQGTKDDGRCYFSAPSEAGKAVVGTPMGLALGVMMLDRFKALSRKTLGAVGVWKDASNDFCTAINLVDFVPNYKAAPEFAQARGQKPDAMVTMRETKFRSFNRPGPLYIYSEGFGSCAGVVIASKKGCLIGHYNSQKEGEKFVAEGLVETIQKNKALLQGGQAYLFVPYEIDPKSLPYPWQKDQLAKVIKDSIGMTPVLKLHSETLGMGADDWMDYIMDLPDDETDYLNVEITRGSIVVKGGNGAEPFVQFEGLNVLTGSQKRAASRHSL